jgi:hypothetical protein
LIDNVFCSVENECLMKIEHYVMNAYKRENMYVCMYVSMYV